MFKKKIYVKDESSDPIYKVKNRDFLIRSRVVPIFLFMTGIGLLGSQVIFPLIYFKSAKDTKVAEFSVLGVVSGFRDFEFEELPIQDHPGKAPQVPDFFTISIPKLGIENALVEVNTPTLNPKEALGHYAGSALPGIPGNSFIYGHSVLPWFFNPKNYKTIFSVLEQLEAGDAIFVQYDGKNFSYTVERKEILYPKDVNPLATIKPKYLNESTLTLMTCVPPGTKLKRLLIYAILD